MSRGAAAAVVATTFVAGSAAGWWLHGGRASDAPALAAPAPGSTPPTREVGREPLRSTVPPPPSRTPSRVAPTGAAQVKSVPTPGHYVRLGANETLSDIAQRAYGSTKRLSEILEANPLLDPKRLPAGTLVYVPVGTEDVPPSPPSLPPSALPPMKTPAPKPVAAPPKAAPEPKSAPAPGAAKTSTSSSSPAAPPSGTK